jgi:protein subunit release factor A
MNHLDIELRAWPPGSPTSKAVIAIHTPTGVAVIARSEPTSGRNQTLAVERLGILLSEANSPGGWQR